jgi:hypothetical protein
MISPNEFRVGNLLLQKVQNRVVTVSCSPDHFALMAKGELKDLYPLVLKAELLQKCGFVENGNYALLPSAREFILVLPVKSSHKNEIYAYIKSNGECFARAMANGLPVSNNVYQMHQLQNLYYALTGEEMVISKL